MGCFAVCGNNINQSQQRDTMCNSFPIWTKTNHELEQIEEIDQTQRVNQNKNN